MNLAGARPEASGSARPGSYLLQALRPTPEMILESISDVLEVIDPRGRIIYSNMPFSFQGMLGLDRVLEGSCGQIHGKACLSCAERPLNQVLNTGRSMTLECPVDLGGGKTGWVRQRLYPVMDGQGEASAVLRMVFDITRQKREQAKEAEYVDSLEQALCSRGSAEEPAPAQDLSAREREVLSFLAEGLSNQEIARLLGISHHTVKSHVVHIFNKLGVNDRTQAAVKAFRLKLIGG